MSDIKFEGNEVIVEGSALKVTARDVEVDNEGRRSESNTPHRRALVHDYQDGLTINWAKDYPGGVVINGEVRCPDKLFIGSTDVQQTISSLQEQIDALRARVQDLETNE